MRDLWFVPRHDPYAYTETGRTWINHEWLAEWMFGWTYDVAGSRGLVVLKLSFVAAVFGLAAHYLRRRGVGTVLAAIMLLLLALTARPALATLRSHVFTILFFLVVFLILRAFGDRPALLWLLRSRVQKSMDCRWETVYPDSVYQAYLALQTGEGDWSCHLEDSAADLALASGAGPVANFLELSPGWTRHFEGSVGVFYALYDVNTTLPEVDVPPNHQVPLDLADDRQSGYPK